MDDDIKVVAKIVFGSANMVHETTYDGDCRILQGKAQPDRMRHVALYQIDDSTWLRATIARLLRSVSLG